MYESYMITSVAYIMKKYIFKYHNMYCIYHIYIYDKYIRTPCIKLLH